MENITAQIEVPFRAKRMGHFHTVDSFPKDILSNRSIIVEVNAGNDPIGIDLATKFPQNVVISQDIVFPSRNKVKKHAKKVGINSLPENFHYYIGDLSQLELNSLLALFSVFPSNLPETMNWLPQLVNKVHDMNPSLYVAILIEKVIGRPEIGKSYGLDQKLLNALRNQDLKPEYSEVDFEQIAKAFGQTEYLTHLRYRAKNVALIELNKKRREEFLKL